jgi:16S rRNA (cytosine1402-N4)-methyltransferase
VAAALANPDLGAAPTTHEASGHETVLLCEAVNGLMIDPSGIYVDATFGRGGHSLLILQALGPAGKLIAMDRDPQAVVAAQQLNDPRFHIIHAPFSALESQLHALGVTSVNGVLLDLGVSSPQLDSAERGFSFQGNGPLDMRMDPTSGEPVSAWLTHVSTSELVKVIADYGEERFAFPIADAITARCAAAAKGQAAPLATTRELADLVTETLRRCGARKEIGRHPATRTFQALRIHINHELQELEAVLPAATRMLGDHGRIAIISFHSLEDRLVKQFIRDQSGKAPTVRPKGVSRGQHALLQSMHPDQHEIVLKPIARIRPSAEEINRNPRARSATLRIAQRVSRHGAQIQ